MDAVPAKQRSRSAGHRQPGEEVEGPLTPPVFDATFRDYQPSDHESLVEMYVRFQPKGAFQGLPPHDERLIREWLDQLLKNASLFFVAVSGDRVVGHAMLCPSKHNTAELAIFLDQDFRNMGIGKRLLLGTLHYARKRLQLSKVWLSVQGANVPALRLFQETGFEPSDRGDPLFWEIRLQRPVNCGECLGNFCDIFGEPLPNSATYFKPTA